VIEPSRDPLLGSLRVSDQTLPLDNVVDLNVMARRELRDEMPGMIFRNITRAIAKSVVQDQLEKQAGAFGALIGSIASAATEQADDRMWRSLPGRVYLARAYLPPGEHLLTVGGRSLGTVKVNGRYALVPVRLYEDSVVQLPVSTFGQLASVPTPAPETQAAAAATTNGTVKPQQPRKTKKAAAAGPT
jgi:hypothetical protein